MPVYELDFNDITTNEYSLIGIHTTLLDYKLAYILNGRLGFLFKKSSFSLDFTTKWKTETSFPVFEYHHPEYSSYLIGNVSKNIMKTETTSLFPQSTVINHLVPESKKVDYFLKIEGEYGNDFIDKLVYKIKKNTQIITSYKIEVDSLKSRDFLIF